MQTGRHTTPSSTPRSREPNTHRKAFTLSDLSPAGIQSVSPNTPEAGRSIGFGARYPNLKSDRLRREGKL